MEVVMQSRFYPVCLFAVLAGAVSVHAQDARAVIEKAILAHGGMERLNRLQADRIKVKGSLYINEKAVPFSGEALVQLPTRLKNTFQLTMDNKTILLVQIVNAENAWVTLDGQPQKVEPTALAEMREKLALSRAMRLVPLLVDRSYELSALGEIKVGDRPAVGVRVAVKGRKDLRLYFDKESGLLVKSEHTLDDAAGKEVVEEGFYSDFRNLGGFIRPTKTVVLRKGAKVMEAEFLEVKYSDRFEDAEFSKP
jgi:hypothetical protein